MLLAKVLLFSQGRIKRQNHLFKRNLSVKPSRVLYLIKGINGNKNAFFVSITASIYSQNQGIGRKVTVSNKNVNQIDLS